MNLIDGIKEKIGKGKKYKDDEIIQTVNELSESLQEMKKTGQPNPIDTTVEKVMEIIQEDENPDKMAEKILQATLEDEQMPDKVTEKVAVKITKSDEIDDNVVTNVIDNTEVDLKDELIETIIEEGNINDITDRTRLIQKIENEIRMKQLKERNNKIIGEEINKVPIKEVSEKIDKENEER